MFSLPRWIRWAATRVAPPVSLALVLAACDSPRGLNLAPDEPPTVTITSGPIDTVSAPSSWLVDITWVGSDPDGRIDHFEYAIDPPTLKSARMAMAETAWVSTQAHHVVARFRASHPDSLGPGATASDFHVFVLRAVDDRGGVSPDVVRAFYAYTVAPDVQFTAPAPNPLLPAQVGIPFRLTWTGNDPDGAGTTQPVMYRLLLLPLDGGQNTEFILGPDSLLTLGAQTNWAGWRTVGGDTTSILVNRADLLPNTRWMAAIVAVDGAGATTPYLSYDRNLLVFNVLLSGGPSVHVFSSIIDYTGSPSSLEFTPPTDAPAGQALTFHFEGIASAGRKITGTRWAVDIADFNDETPRSDEATDLAHWSVQHEGVITVTFPITSGRHQLAIQTFDDLGGSSLLSVRLNGLVFLLDRDLLVVDDTRLEVDKFDAQTGCTFPYTTMWPSRAEMDTFLFARGGMPWRCTKNPTTGVLSPPGLLAGYAFDTLGTRLGLEDPVAGVSLGILGRYRHVLWLTDQKSAAVPAGFPIPVLRAMCAPGQTNTLAQYVQAGGQVWLAGGGAAYASLINFAGRPTSCPMFTFDNGVLVPGRMMYDEAHVRSAMSAAISSVAPARSAAARGGWSGHGPDGTLSAPDYSRLPAQLHFKTAATDPIPPTRVAAQAALFYRTNSASEFVAAPDTIVENFDRSGAGERLESALDTLYDVADPSFCVSPAPAMLYYHGRDNAPFVFTGFDLWSWSQADCQGLVDFVLGDIWKLPKSAPGVRAARSVNARTPQPFATRRLDPRIMRP